nr:transporter [Olegusella massiliensis]
MTKSKIKVYLSLQLLLMFYSLSTVLSKVASSLAFPSSSFMLCYIGIIGILGIYALGWQQIIKHLPLITAYANRAVTVVWGLIWGALIFHENMSILKLIGGLVVLIGVILYAAADTYDEDTAGEGKA